MLFFSPNSYYNKGNVPNRQIKNKIPEGGICIMKKFLKILGRLAIVGAAIAGGVAIYKKYFAPEDTFDDLD